MFVVIMGEGPEGDLRAFLKPGNVGCPHLSFAGREASCAVYDRKEYAGSPCWVYGNSDVDPDFEMKRGKPCIIGKFYRGRKDDLPKGAKSPDRFKRCVLNDLEDVGPWGNTELDVDE
jgi:hypothetical protein